ncbi:MAG: ATP-binding cassette domain-containing protein [Firmicutes bacterium]|nr:ATP-binding cassette domain-containing protein [Bacillota bacterium]
MAEEKKVILSLKDVEVKFNVRGRILTAIRGVSLDIFDHESLAIVGESGSGKSVLTKTFAGMLDSNGFISNGTIIFSDDDLSKTDVVLDSKLEAELASARDMLNKHSKLERGAGYYNKYLAKKDEIEHLQSLSKEEEEAYSKKIKDLTDKSVSLKNFIQTLDRKNAEDKARMEASEAQVREYEAQLEALSKEMTEKAKARAAEYQSQTEKVASDKAELEKLLALSKEAAETVDVEGNPNGLSDAVLERNEIIAREIILSIGRYSARDQKKFLAILDKGFEEACRIGRDLNDPEVRNDIFDEATFRVRYDSYDEATKTLHGYAIIDCAKVKRAGDWQQIRGRKIATVFQDPMTSLNPVITIGKQIMTVILKHQKCSQEEARKRTIDIMAKVGIPEPEQRFDDYPFQYSGGMRQRIVIAIALSCQPRILICDEPTTALDVTIQAQILELIKQLQRDLGFTVVYITHDLGVVANVAERVAVLYAGQIVEIGTVEEIFYEPRHPYTWALLSSLPQLSEKGTDLFSIPGTPPSLYNKIVGDAFAPRNQYAMAIDLKETPPMFRITDTHFARTWLCDPRAPKVDPPANILDLHEKMKKSHVEIQD